jgi:hypothetical protein
MSSKTLNKDDLMQFTGTATWYRHSLNSNVFYTEEALYLAKRGHAHWLLDEIALIQAYEKAVATEEFQAWTLVVRADRSATLTCDDGNGRVVFKKQVPFTDFPLDEVSLWLSHWDFRK